MNANNRSIPLSRADFLKVLGGAGAVAVAGPALASPSNGILKRTVPSSGEKIPVIGLGTSRVFDIGNDPAEQAPRKEVLRAMVDAGATLIDTAPSYGQSEAAVGTLVADLGIRKKVFLATKVGREGKEDGIAENAESFKVLRTDMIDLIQIHNLIGWETQLKTLRELKDKGKIRYVGITHYLSHAYDELSDAIAKEKFDFVQLGYSFSDRGAEKRILQLAADRGTAVMVNRTFGSRRASQFQKVRGKELPPWAKDFDCTSWGQFFLKFVLSHPAVTCVIPGTSKAKHMLDNLQAGRGRLPSAQERQKMVQYWEGL
jgi:aryl-alcohol dehydrogenase-like predicted oxidoreductase